MEAHVRGQLADFRQSLHTPPTWEDPGYTFLRQQLPPLPSIPDSELAERAVRHFSAPELHRVAGSTQKSGILYRNRYSYEILEAVGDRLVNFFVYRQLHRLYPRATPSILGNICFLLTANRTLSYIALAYDMHKRLVHGRPDDLVQNQKVVADLFEAHIGALCECEDSRPGSASLYTWLEALFSPTVWPDVPDTVVRLEEQARRRRNESAAAEDLPASVGLAGSANGPNWSCADCDNIENDYSRVSSAFDWHDPRKGWHVRLEVEGIKASCGRGHNKPAAEKDAVSRLVAASRTSRS